MLKNLITLFIFSLTICLKAQSKAEQALKIFEQKYPQEKVHLVFDKKNYIAGENLWFKSFVFDGYNPSNISTTLYVELYDKNKLQITKKLIPLFKGEGHGSITLPEKLKEDVYYIRAYTSWMANFSEQFQLLQPIEIYNPSSPEKLVPNDTSKWTATIYPESGTFVDGINTKFAVRIQSSGIAPSNWSGYVIESGRPSEKITSFKGFDQNVGLFNFTPKSDKKYQLVVQDDKGVEQHIDFPNVSNSGINLQVTSNSDVIQYTLRSKNLTQDSKYYTVLGTINSQLIHKAQFKKLSEQSYTIPTNNLVNGILQLVVFDDKENIIAQRLCFVQPEILKVKKPLIQELSLKKEARESNSFNITKEPNYSNYSILIQDSETEGFEDENNFLTKLWLTGDITSEIAKPAQYFSKNNNSEALDALLISERWKRFDWKTIISGIYPEIKHMPESSYITYKGRVTVDGQPAVNASLNLIFDIPDHGIKFFEVHTDSNGIFTLTGMIFEDTMKMSYQLNKELKYKNAKVFFQPNYNFISYSSNFPRSKFILTKRFPDDKLAPEMIRSIETKNTLESINEKITNIEEVRLKVFKKDRTKKLNEQLSSPLFRSINEEVFDFVNEHKEAQTSSNVLQWLQARVAGLQVNYEQGYYVPYIRDRKADIYLNEMKVSNDQVSNLPVSSIAMVKVIKGMFLNSMNNGGGVILVYTHKGTLPIDPEIQKNLGIKQYTFKGYDKEEPFNSPVYDNPEFKKIPKDNRSVLYWNPNYEIKPNETTTIQFFNNDSAKNYKIIIMGFDNNNDPFYYSEIL